jgi:ketosteroid isomerase-like protein
MKKWIAIIALTGLTTVATPATAASKSSDELMFEKVFSNWTNAFDHKDLAGTCSLFSNHIIANYQGAHTKTYTSLCNSFKKIFQEQRDYQYTFNIRNINRSNNLAAVRITWHLRVSQQGKFISESKDESMDIFERDKRGNWKIINYLGYPAQNQKSQH